MGHERREREKGQFMSILPCFVVFVVNKEKKKSELAPNLGYARAKEAEKTPPY